MSSSSIEQTGLPVGVTDEVKSGRIGTKFNAGIAVVIESKKHRCLTRAICNARYGAAIGAATVGARRFDGSCFASRAAAAGVMRFEFGDSENGDVCEECGLWG